VPPDCAEVHIASKIASAAGAQHVCYCFSPQAAQGHTYESVADQLTRTGEMYAASGIAFSFHNHTGSMMGTLAECRRMCDRLDPKTCGITFDTAHAAACGMDDLGAAIEGLRTHINNVHLKDLNHAGKFCPLGTGKLPLASVVTALRAIAYNDWLIVDEESAGVACADACQISMAFLKDNGIDRR
jgi:sugar phosphate isomerase/epimerase